MLSTTNEGIMKINADLMKFFSRDELESMAKDSKLVTRSSPITGFCFGMTFTVGLLNTPNATLKQLTAFLNNNCNNDISPQALDQRIDESAVTFMKQCLAKAIEISIRKVNVPIGLISTFKHVYIIDSTNFDLHPSLKDTFKGNGGGASASSMRIQFIYDYLSGRLHLEIGDVRLSDATTLKDIVKTRKLGTDGNTLFLQDLGYFSSETYLTIANDTNYFISKLKFNMKIFDVSGDEVDLLGLLRRKPKSIDITIQVGDLKCRLVGEKLSKKMRNQRIHSAESDAKKKNRRPISADYRLFLGFGLFITNLTNYFTAQYVYTIYRLRWQIELIFKSWKSILEIHKIHSAKIHRIMCEVIGKIIISIILMGISGQIQDCQDFPFSYFQCLQYFKAIASNWAQTIFSGELFHARFLKQIFSQLIRFCKKRKQKTRSRIEDLVKSIPPKMVINRKIAA